MLFLLAWLRTRTDLFYICPFVCVSGGLYHLQVRLLVDMGVHAGALVAAAFDTGVFSGTPRNKSVTAVCLPPPAPGTMRMCLPHAMFVANSLYYFYIYIYIYIYCPWC